MDNTPMSKHTPGPWRLFATDTEDAGATTFEVVGADGMFVVSDLVGIPSYENARLIAAAPDMYEALKEAQIFLNVGASYAPNTAESIKFATGEYLKTRGLADVMRAVAEKCGEAIKKYQTES